jgi:hypothetical protein
MPYGRYFFAASLLASDGAIGDVDGAGEDGAVDAGGVALVFGADFDSSRLQPARASAASTAMSIIGFIVVLLWVGSGSEN